MSPPNHLHLDPFLSSYPPQSLPSLVSSPPNYQHELIVAPDGWRSTCELPVAHNHPIIVVVEAFWLCRAASRPAAPCRRRVASLRRMVAPRRRRRAACRHCRAALP